MKHTAVRTAIVGLTFLGGVAIASEPTQDSGFYIGAKTGLSYFANSCEPHDLNCDESTAGAGLFLGYNFTDWLAIESGYHYLGKAKASYPALTDPTVRANYEAEVMGLEIGLKANYALSPDWGLFAKVGGLSWQVDKTGHEINNTVKNKENGASLMLGSGLEYRFTPSLKGRFEYQWFNNVGDQHTGGSDVNFVTLGLAYSFGAKAAPEEIAPVQVEPVVEPTPPPMPTMITIAAKEDMSLFAVNSVEPTEHTKRQLIPLIEHAQHYPQVDIHIVGHTDSTGKEAYNLSLSKRRAEAIALYLASQGISPERMSTDGQGELSPVASNETRLGRAQNRRVEITISETKVPQEDAE